MTWEPESDELRKRMALARKMGGDQRVARQHEFGKLTVRERIGAIAAPGSFREMGALAGKGEYDARLAEIRQRLDRVRSPFRTAEFFEIEDIIDPRDSRPVLCQWVHLARRTLRPGRRSFGIRP